MKVLLTCVLLCLYPFAIFAKTTVAPNNADDFLFDLIKIVFILILLYVVLYLYFLPTIIARRKKHKSTFLIFLLNLFGGTVVFWIIAYVWADNGKDEGR